jgi:hypothetical protein
MAIRKKVSSVKPVKTAFEVIGESAMKRQAKHPERVKEIDRIMRDFLARARHGEMLDPSSALQQFETEIRRVCTPRISYHKSSDQKKRPAGKGVSHRFKVANGHMRGTPKVKRKAGPRKHQSSKKII